MDKWINASYLDKKKIRSLKAAYTDAKPFQYLELPAFFNEQKARSILQALISVRFYEKEADLFHFYQTNDIASVPNELLQEFRSFLMSREFLDYMRALTELKFKIGVIDLAG